MNEEGNMVVFHDINGIIGKLAKHHPNIMTMKTHMKTVYTFDRLRHKLQHRNKHNRMETKSEQPEIMVFFGATGTGNAGGIG